MPNPGWNLSFFVFFSELTIDNTEHWLYYGYIGFISTIHYTEHYNYPNLRHLLGDTHYFIWNTILHMTYTQLFIKVNINTYIYIDIMYIPTHTLYIIYIHTHI